MPLKTFNGKLLIEATRNLDSHVQFPFPLPSRLVCDRAVLPPHLPLACHVDYSQGAHGQHKVSAAPMSSTSSACKWQLPRFHETRKDSDIVGTSATRPTLFRRVSVSAFMLAAVVSGLHVPRALRCFPSHRQRRPQGRVKPLRRRRATGGEESNWLDWRKWRHAGCGRCRWLDSLPLFRYHSLLHLVPCQQHLKHVSTPENVWADLPKQTVGARAVR
ncbi:hypothetical protein P154DRAFT_194755 [Amniculicola lignicola CBS 123094]|uniref:Uncharacterized protein n=1 Tax=Amniculicola lignicola CBS 123094 TaxID=1392246 RepID=A0A6A5WFV4_9PLEO|nr:hypothetical protein P154DRAFT_194755 [Amniculicola lignicola CBS 123094]